MKLQVTIPALVVTMLATVAWSYPKHWDPNAMQISGDMLTFMDQDESWDRDCSELCRHVNVWLRTQAEEDGLTCDRLADSLMDKHEDRVDAFFVAAEWANLRGHTDKAIGMLRVAWEIYPERKPSYINQPTIVLAHFHAAAYAKQVGDVPVARVEYEAVLRALATAPQSNVQRLLVALCYTYLNELDASRPGQQDAIRERISLIKTRSAILGQWVAYEDARNREGAVAARRALILSEDDLQRLTVLSDGILKYSGILQGPLVHSLPRANHLRMAELRLQKLAKAGSRLDYSAALFASGKLCESKRAYADAERYYAALLDCASLLSPCSGFALMRCNELQGKNTEMENVRAQLRQAYPRMDWETRGHNQ